MLKTSQRQRGSVRRHGKQRRRAAPNNVVAQRLQEGRDKRRDRHTQKVRRSIESFCWRLNRLSRHLARNSA